MYIHHIVLLLGLFSNVFSISIEAFKNSRQLHEVHGFHPQKWQLVGRASSEQSIQLRISLAKEKSDEELDEILQEIADVRSPQYGQYLEEKELKEYWKPSFQAQEAMENLIELYDQLKDKDHVFHVSKNSLGDYWNLKMNVSLAEEMFQTSLYEFQHQEYEHVKLIRPHLVYSLPSGLQKNHIVFIDGLQSFPTEPQALMIQTRAAATTTTTTTTTSSSSTSTHTRLQRQSLKSMEAKEEEEEDPRILAKKFSSQMNDRINTPSIIRQQYEIPENWHLNSTHERNQLIVATFLKEFYKEKDLVNFMSFFEPKSFSSMILPSHTKECIEFSKATGEASLDIQVVMAFSKNEKIQMKCYTQLRDPTKNFADDNQEPFLTFLQDLNAMKIPASVASISYTDDECAIPQEYAKAVNHELMKASMRGTTVVISAGDAGVQGSSLASNFCGFPSCTRFEALFPASSPYVLSVGATSRRHSSSSFSSSSLQRGQTKFEEVVTSTANGNLITSGGGFSRLFKTPYYQKELIEQYLQEATQLNSTAMFDSKGRGYPDIAAIGSNFPVIENNELIPTDGTSVSAPIIASLLVLINKILLDRQLPILGFVNPLFYQMAQICPQVFHDILEGQNACGSLSMDCCEKGHFATKGWDATSGIGTLKFETFINSYEKCIQSIKATAIPQQQTLDLMASPTRRDTELQRRVQDVAFGLSLLASVVLGSVLFTMRNQLFITNKQREEEEKKHLIESKKHSFHRHCRPHESALEYLLAAQH